MNHVMKKVGILLGIFVVAVGIYFVMNQRTVEKTETVYTTMEEAALPLVYTEMFGDKVNLMHGYLQNMGQAAMRGGLTVLPEDRQMKVRIVPYSGQITTVRYEIRSLDMERLVERTQLEDWQEEDGEILAVLPIQNLLVKEKEYLLDLILSTPDQEEIHYYSRIMWSDNVNVQQMIDFAVDFSGKTFDYNQARELVTYLETNASEDNSSLGNVTIRSSFSQLTWGDLGVRPEGEVRVTLKELDGIMANIQLDYLVSRDSAEGNREVYEISENFTLKWNTQRIYMMDYQRKMNELFDGTIDRFSGHRIMMGISSGERICTLKSPDKRYLAFVTNGDLWSYDEKEQSAVRVFSFGSGTDDGLRSNYLQHDIKILSVKDTGDMDFLVYGYMNRGVHEGMVGVALYRYSQSGHGITEKFFAPVTRSFPVLQEDIGQLSYLSPNDMFYVMIDRSVYGIDLNSNEYLVLADGLLEGTYAFSDNQSRFAWQDGSSRYGSAGIRIMNLETGRKQDIAADKNDLLRVLGFVGNDLICGLAREGDEWVMNGRVAELPMYALEIMDDDLNVETRYEKDGYYICQVRVQDSRVHLNRISKLGGGQYSFVDEDTLVSNGAEATESMEGIGWYASTDKRKVYFVQIEQEIKGGKAVSLSASREISYQTSGFLQLKSNQILKDDCYYAYSNGLFRGMSSSFFGAVNLAYDGMGIVTDSNQRIVWSRVNRSGARTIKDPASAAKKLMNAIEDGLDNKTEPEGMLVLDARGCLLNQVLYFVDKGCPVAAYRENGQYYLISGFDQYNITLYDPATGESSKMGLNDGANYFKNMKNDFICAVMTD